jgi:hypothetical protein
MKRISEALVLGIALSVTPMVFARSPLPAAAESNVGYSDAESLGADAQVEVHVLSSAERPYPNAAGVDMGRWSVEPTASA